MESTNESDNMSVKKEESPNNEMKEKLIYQGKRYLTGVADALNYPAFYRILMQNKEIAMFLATYIIGVIAIFFPFADYLDARWNPDKIQVPENTNWLFRQLYKMPKQFLYQLFCQIPWGAILLVVCSITCQLAGKILRKHSFLAKYNAAHSIEASIEESNEKKPAANFILKTVIGFAPTIGMVTQNVLITALPFVGRYIGYFIRRIYTAYLSFSSNWSLITPQAASESDLLPKSRGPLDGYAFAGRNWIYFLGFSLPSYAVSLLFPHKPYTAQVISKIYSVISVVMAFNVVEKIEAKALKLHINAENEVSEEKEESQKVSTSVPTNKAQEVVQKVLVFCKSDSPLGVQRVSREPKNSFFDIPVAVLPEMIVDVIEGFNDTLVKQKIN
ncbi:uncharacterized protein MONOS_5249 [Monocercomonoides exilis]|uniref:uncharacterized protein n=1 Tax=Monocercomonoides exilis TaxID=2049356 RepID=UPI003559A11B|nr:hypothetical protein MONOS_5249 [Monocercomonoides exilis]|eukprot:MONOS_5249.1-p1 / transcript=MONOS_5249.1 / gene=MONOS_5249 / organism=Monocercomonoides_exilis_PA203 / gene_product=unspecified product / transcript_product=unspecified product / location=Mono_scaffold00150:104102-105389(+) / protein_length=387 / sequence_SO=supercontig / SO=protein_coding / is_pseudo=false